MIRGKRAWRWAVLGGLTVWYVAANCGLWAGLEPSTVLYRASITAVCAVVLSLAWLGLLGHD